MLSSAARLFAIVFLCSRTIGGYEVRDGPLLTTRPQWLKVCRKSDPGLNTCFNQLFTNIFPELAKGIPEINVDRFEPLLLDRVTISKGAGPITLTGGLFNLFVTGPSNASTTYTILDVANKTLNIGLHLPLINIKSQYNLKGRILVLPLIGHGACEMRLVNVNSHITAQIALPLVEGREIVKIEKMHVNFRVGSMKVKLHNLFNGNKILGETVNAFVNQHSAEIIDELQDSVGESLAQIFTDITNNVFNKVPTDLWLLDDEQYRKYLKESHTR